MAIVLKSSRLLTISLIKFFSVSVKTKCGEKSGVCRLVDSRANYKMCAGDFSQTLSYDKVITLKYVNGDICPQCKCKRETVITFVCAPEEGEGKPVFMSQVEDCTYVFVWRTKNVCQREVRKHFVALLFGYV